MGISRPWLFCRRSTSHHSVTEQTSDWSSCLFTSHISNQGKRRHPPRCERKTCTNDSNAQVAAFTDIRVDQDNPEFVGKWEGYGGFSNRALPNGDDTFLKFNFSGEEITIGFNQGPEFGSAEVMVDGVSRARICNYSQTYTNNNVTIDRLGQSLHELRIYPRDDTTCSQRPRNTQVLQFFVP